MRKIIVGTILSSALLVAFIGGKDANGQSCHGDCFGVETASDPAPKTVENCPKDMIEIKGEYCTNLEEICLKYGDPDNKGANGPVQCLEFKYPTRCLSKTVPMHYCIDKYPYPNKPEEKPTTQLDWYQAKKLCETEGKRLCTTHEFTQACRGRENKPYPYGNGYVR